MSLSATLLNLLDADTSTAATGTSSKRQLRLELAADAQDMRAAQRLRYQVFVEEMGARLPARDDGIECDGFDEYCHHLLVKDRDHVVGCYRILTDVQADRAGGYYSQSEFDLTRVLAQPGRFMEIGRTCVHPDYRSGATIALLWQGLARFMVVNQIDYLMGCASIPLRGGTREARLIYERLARRHLAAESWRVFPRVPLPHIQHADGGARHGDGAPDGSPAAPEEPVNVPTLIKGYLRAGALICGEPAWDPQFNVADLFILLSADRISARHTRHFMQRA
jgi:putative hemolysin